MRGYFTTIRVAPTDLDKAWAAGFFEGEGSVLIRLEKRQRVDGPCWNYKAAAQCSNCDTEPLLWLQERWGGSLAKNTERANWKVCWTWGVTGAAALRFVRDIFPYVKRRMVREKLIIVRQFQERRKVGHRLTVADRVRDEHLRQQLKILNKRGRSVDEN